MSRVGETGEKRQVGGSRLILGSRRLLSQSEERLRWRDRRDSNPKLNDAQSHSEKGIPPFRSEVLTQVLTHFSGKDCQMLTQVVKKWGSLRG